jgi:hypothetical protein
MDPARNDDDASAPSPERTGASTIGDRGSRYSEGERRGLIENEGRVRIENRQIFT